MGNIAFPLRWVCQTWNTALLQKKKKKATLHSVHSYSIRLESAWKCSWLNSRSAGCGEHEKNGGVDVKWNRQFREMLYPVHQIPTRLMRVHYQCCVKRWETLARLTFGGGFSVGVIRVMLSDIGPLDQKAFCFLFISRALSAKTVLTEHESQGGRDGQEGGRNRERKTEPMTAGLTGR